jgi:hypothetical protein
MAGDSPLFRHSGLNRIDIQRPRGQVIDMRSFESDDIRHQRMSFAQRVVRFRGDGSGGLPFKSQERVGD